MARDAKVGELAVSYWPLAIGLRIRECSVCVGTCQRHEGGHWPLAFGHWRVVQRTVGTRRDMPTACPEMREAVSHWRLVQSMENLRSPKRQPGTDSALPWRPPRLRGEKKAKTQVQLDFIPGLANGQKPMAKLLKTPPL